jgi:hypothetical protein
MAMPVLRIPSLQLQIIPEFLQISPGDMQWVLGSDFEAFSPRPKRIFTPYRTL